MLMIKELQLFLMYKIISEVFRILRPKNKNKIFMSKKWKGENKKVNGHCNTIINNINNKGTVKLKNSNNKAPQNKKDKKSVKFYNSLAKKLPI